MAEANAQSSGNMDDSASDNFVDLYLANLFNEDTANLNTSAGSTSTDTFLTEIVKLETRPKVSIIATSGQESMDILHYWKQRKVSNPHMYLIAMALLSIPSTQVTVERLFSQLKLVMTDARTRLGDQRIKDIMLLKMNKSLWPEVIKVLEAELVK